MNRRDGIGGSDCAAAVGVDPRCTPYALWRRKTGLDPEFAGSAATRRGHFLEAALLSRWCAECQPASFEAGGEVIVGWQFVHPDGLAVMADGQRRLVEAKSVSKHVHRNEWGAPWSDDVPERVLCQVLWGCLLTGADLADIPVAVVPEDPDEVMGIDPAGLLEKADVFIYRVQRNREVEDWLVRKAAAFWFDHVKAGVAPEAISIEDARLLWPSHTTGKVVKVTPAIVDLIRKYELLGEAEAERKRVREQLLLIAEDAEAFVGPDGVTPLVTLKTVKRKGYSVAPSESRTVKTTAWWTKAQLGAPGTPKELTQPQETT